MTNSEIIHNETQLQTSKNAEAEVVDYNNPEEVEKIFKKKDLLVESANQRADKNYNM
jgi:predicted dinucleotide-utilizing enzyme